MITETKRQLVREKLRVLHEIKMMAWSTLERDAFGKVTNTLSNFVYKKTGMMDENLMKVMQSIGMSTADINDRAKVDEEKNVVEDPILKEMKEKKGEKDRGQRIEDRVKQNEEQKVEDEVKNEEKTEKHRITLTMTEEMYRRYAGIAMAVNIEIKDMMMDAAEEYMERILYALREVAEK